MNDLGYCTIGHCGGGGGGGGGVCGAEKGAEVETR